MIKLGPLGFLKNRKDSGRVHRIRISSDNKYIKKVSSKILEGLEDAHPDESVVFDIRLCTEEAVRNAIVHGNRSDRRLSVKVDFWIENDNLNIEIEDEGSGFDARMVADPTAKENVTRNCGRGVYLIRHLMDSVEYNEKGNKVLMTKRLK